MRRLLLHTVWILVIALLGTALAAFHYVGWTEAGFQTLASRLSRRIGPVTLQLEGARGSLANGAHLDSVTLDHRRSHIEVRNLEFRVTMLSLFWGSIRIEEARAETALVRVLPRTEDNPNWKPRFLRPPLSIEIRKLTIGSGALVSTGGREFDASDILASGIVRPYTLRVHASSMQYAGMTVQANGEVRAARPFGLTGDVHFAMAPPDQPAWSANASIDGDLDEIAITGAITEPLSASFVGTATRLTSDWHWQGQSQLKRLDLTAWGAGDALGVITGTLQMDGDRSGIRATGPLTPPGLQAGPLHLDFAGSYAERVLTAARLQFVHRPSGTQLNASGTIGIVTDGPRLNLRGNWRTLRWPLADADAPVHSDGGQYTLQGLWPYALQASGELRAQQWPTMQFSGSGLLARDRLTIQQSRVMAFDGQATLTGSAEWSPAERWQMRGMVHGIDVATVRPGIDGRLNFLLEASGEGFGETGMLEARFSSISGTVRGQRARGRAAMALDGEDWLLSDVRLQLGATRLDVDGRVGEHIDVRFDVDAADLALLQTDARGRLVARGTVRGDLKNPVLDLDARGADIRWGDIALGTVSAKIALDPAGSGRADAAVTIDRLSIADRMIDKLEFSSAGTTAAHHAKLTLAAPQLQLNAAGNASLADGIWRWRLAQLRADDGRELQLALESPTLLELGVDHVRVEQLCLRDAQARLCGSGSNLAGKRAVTVAARDLPLRALTTGVAAGTSFDGTLTIDGNAAAEPGAAWTGSLRAVLDKAAVQHRFASGRVESFDLGTGNVTADITPQGLDGRVALDAGAAGRMNGWVSARGTSGAWDQWPISGALQLESDALDMLDSYITQIDRASGRLSASLQFDGTLRAPRLDGELTVSNAQVDAYQINLALRDLSFTARLRDNRLSLDGSTTAGVDGKARFDGELAWRQGLPYGKLHLQGTDLRIVNIPEARVQASPDVNLTVSGRRIDIAGTIELPYARLEQPDQLANAVRTSGDEVIVSAEQSAPSDPFRVYSNVTLKLGDRVTISTSGLTGRLSGAITASNDETGFSRGSGELSIEEGKYTAYGRKLDIVRGRLIFSNSPLGDPGVDLRAAKRFPDVSAGNVTVGVNVRGTLSSPRMTFYSEPAIAQSQIVSLLLAGSIDRLQATAGSASQRDSASREMLTQGSAILAQQFGSKLGIDDISVESTSLQNDTSLVLGRYLSPRLYLSYGVSFAEALRTIKLNYTIGDKWTLRLTSESGSTTTVGTTSGTGADLVYTLER